ncbi:MAG: FmdB family zinc ribbon protein [Chloroflexota bacterium]
MPVYEYQCGQCDHNFEQKQGFDAEPTATCPRCRGKARRVIRSVPVIFKGSGFYVTDHRQSSSTTEPTKAPLPGKGAKEG